MTPKFIFGGDTGVTPEQIARERDLADAMTARGLRGGSRNAWEGMGNLAHAIAGRYKAGQVDKKERPLRRRASQRFDEAFSVLLGAGNTPQVSSAPTRTGTPFVPGAENAPSTGFDPASIYAAIEQVESGGNPNAVSPAGAAGAMQIMPETARDPGYGVPSIFELASAMGVDVPDQSDETLQGLLMEPAVNRKFGALYYDAMRAQHGSDELALAAYNAGPGAVEEYGGIPPFAETQAYVPNVMGRMGQTGTAPGQSQTVAMASGGAPSRQTAQGDLGPVFAALSDPYLGRTEKSLLASALMERMKAPEGMTDYQEAQLGLARDRFNWERGQDANAPAEAPRTVKTTRPDGSEVIMQWDAGSGTWIPLDAPLGAAAPGVAGDLTQSEQDLVLFSSLMDDTEGVFTVMEEQYNPANMQDSAARALPIGEAFFKSSQGQIYDAASNQWAEGALRIATGAAAGQGEIDRTRSTYFAQAGDMPETIQFKATLRASYSRAITAALGRGAEPGELETPEEFARRFMAGEDGPMALDEAQKLLSDEGLQ